MSGDLTQVFGQDFNMDSIEPAVDFIPPGKPPCLIEKAELKENKKGTGYLVALVLSILDDPHKNYKLYVNINIANPNEQCAEIGRRTLRSLWDALSLPPIIPGGDHISQLVDKVVLPHVKVKNGQNEVNAFSAPGAATVILPQTASPQALNPQVPANTSMLDPQTVPRTQAQPKPPWQK